MTIPDAFRTDAPATAVLDVRPILADGGEPFSLIMRTARALPAGGTLEVTTPFVPEPLFDVLGEQGWAHRIVAIDDDGSVTVRFAHSGITADRTPIELVEAYPALQAVLDAHGIDQCCGGAKPLSTIAAAHGLDLPRLLAELQERAVAG